MVDLLSYALAFCRVAVVFVFALAVRGKLRDWAAFKQGIRDFEIIPKSVVIPAAYLIVTGEAIVVVMMLLGGVLLAPGFLIAALLLLTFSIVLASVLTSKPWVSCHCFGTSTTPVSKYDVVRNIGLLACVTIGGLLSTTKPANLEAVEFIFVGLIAVTISVLWTRLGEFARLS